jgi:hypothetical protein
VAVDDTLFRRRGKKAWAASWFHDCSAPGPAKTGYGNNWVVLGIVVRLRFMSRPVAVPVMAKLVIKGSNSRSRLWLARRMAERLAAALPGREVRVVADSAYAGAKPEGLPAGISWTTRLRKDATLHGLCPPGSAGPAGPQGEGRPPPVPGEAGRGCGVLPGHRHLLRQDRDIGAAMVTCLWYSVFGSLPVAVVIVRDRPGSGFGIALVTSDRAITAEQVIERYASRWSIEIAIEDSKQIFGTGQARNRTAAAVERTVPFQIACQAAAVIWYATADMAAKLRRVIIAARFKASCPRQATPQEISLLRLAWEDTAPLAA